MAWMHDNNRMTYVATYKTEKDMRREIEQAARSGWQIANTTGQSGHINVGRTVTAAALTGGLSLLLGASRTKDKLTVTYERTEQWKRQFLPGYAQPPQMQMPLQQQYAPPAQMYAPPAPQIPPQQQQPDFATQLNQLADLHARGILTEAEFVAKKQEILSRM